MQYDTKVIPDKHALPLSVYEQFKHNAALSKYQWTLIDAKARVRFKAWSYPLSSFFGLKFLELVTVWLRAHGVEGKINVQMDRGGEFYSGSKRKQCEWNTHFKRYNVFVYDTKGAKWKQNLVERSHRTDDEVFYIPRGEYMKNKTDFLIEGQHWIINYNNRESTGIGMHGVSPKQKLEELKVRQAKEITHFPAIILEHFLTPLHTLFNLKTERQEKEKSQNVLCYYLWVT